MEYHGEFANEIVNIHGSWLTGNYSIPHQLTVTDALSFRDGRLWLVLGVSTPTILEFTFPTTA
eukprot:124915-Prymnesium_polylepis.2